MAPPTLHVIGRGIVGLSIAWEALRAGFRVTVVGPRARAGSASGAAVGVSSVKGNIIGNSPLFSAKLKAHAGLWGWLEALEKASGKEVPKHRGTLELYENLTGYEAIRERVFHRLFTGCHGVEVLGGKSVAKLFHNLPSFARRVAGAFHYPEDSWFDPTAAMDALEQVLRAGGAAFLEVSVEKIRENPERGLVLETSGGALDAGEVVLAAGIFSQAILTASGLGLGQRLEGVAGETLAGQAPLGLSGVLNAGKMNLALASGRFLFGSSSRPVRSASDWGPSSAFLIDLRARLAAYHDFPGEHAVLWGVRARFRDQAPALGPLFFPGNSRRLWVALGFHKSGLQLAHLFARDLITNIAAPSAFFADSAFSPARFDA